MSSPLLFFFNRCTFAHLYRPKKLIIPRFKPVSYDIPEQKAAAIYCIVPLDCNHEKRRRHSLSALKSAQCPTTTTRYSAANPSSGHAPRSPQHALRVLMVAQLAPGLDAQLLQRGVQLPARRGAGGARPEVEAVGVARCWWEGGPFQGGFGGRAAARAEGGAEEGFRDAGGVEGGGGTQVGGVAGWCGLRGSEVAACLGEAGCGEAVVGGVRKMVVRWRKWSGGLGWKYEGGFTAGFEEKAVDSREDDACMENEDLEVIWSSISSVIAVVTMAVGLLQL